MAAADTTTIKVRVATRTRLNQMLTEPDFKGWTTDELITHLLDERWKQQVVADWDRFREENPDEWHNYLLTSDAAVTDQWGRRLAETEGPYLFGDVA